jgi:hypothetical protein
MTFTLGSETNRDKWTWSCWVKKCINGVEKDIMNIPTDNNNALLFKFNSDALIHGSYVGNASVGSLQTNRLFRDPSAWYHLVIVWDSANATAGNRMRMYVNGVEETSFETDSNPSSGQDSWFYSGKVVNIGRDGRGTGLFDGYMAEIVFCDGQAYAASDFGEFNSDSPTIWKPKDVSELTFGNNGFWLDFEDSSALGNDVSGNNNDFSVTNLAAIDITTDTPTNNFATYNPLTLKNNPGAYYITFSEGNLKIAGNSATNNGNGHSTMGFNRGKWYYEVKIIDVQGDVYPTPGVVPENLINDGDTGSSGQIGYNGTDTVGYGSDGDKIINDSGSSYGDTYTDNDIIGIAIDCDNGAVYFSKNGTFQNSGDPTSGATKTNAAMTFTPSKYYFFGCSVYQSTAIVEANFGNPPFSISSGNADANGYGNFEHAVPSGYYSLCTKNLAEFG